MEIDWQGENGTPIYWFGLRQVQQTDQRDGLRISQTREEFTHLLQAFCIFPLFLLKFYVKLNKFLVEENNMYFLILIKK